MRDDGLKSFQFGLAAIRELRIRQGRIKPREGNAREERWAREGIPENWIDMKRLDTVREG